MFRISIILIFLLAPQYALGNLGLNGGFFAGVGSYAQDDGLDSRLATTYGFYVRPGISVTPLLSIGPYLEYHVSSQFRTFNESSNTDISGSGYLVGGAASIHVGPLFFMGVYSPIGAYTFDNIRNLGGDEVTSPAGIRLMAALTVAPFIKLSLSYDSLSYGEISNNGASRDLDNKHNWEAIKVGITADL